MILSKLTFSGTAQRAARALAPTHPAHRQGSTESEGVSEISFLKSDVQELAKSRSVKKPSSRATTNLLTGLRHSSKPEISSSPGVESSILLQSIEKDDSPDQLFYNKNEDMELEPVLSSEERAEGAVALDPKDSERQYWTDPATQIRREVWRPGDGDGDKAADYFDKRGAAPPIEKRWRFYQSNTGTGPVVSGKNEPPKYVILDDRSAHECLSSKIPRQYLKQYWGHDFGGSGTMRVRRPHRGRASIIDSNAEGDDKYNFTKLGNGDKYYFTGEKDYKPIVYRTSDSELAMAAFKPAKRGLPSPPPRKELPSNKHGHNQFTPKDQMVKHGAAHKGTSYLRYRPRVNAFLTREKSPPHIGRKAGMSVLNTYDQWGRMQSPGVPIRGEATSFTEEDMGLFIDEEHEEEDRWPSAKRLKTYRRADSILDMESQIEEDGESMSTSGLVPDSEAGVGDDGQSCVEDLLPYPRSSVVDLEAEIVAAERVIEEAQARILHLEKLKAGASTPQ